MTLAEYVEKYGKSVKTDLHKSTGLRWQTIHDIAEGRSVPRLETAKKLAAATGGEVTVVDLLGLQGLIDVELDATGS